VSVCLPVVSDLIVERLEVGARQLVRQGNTGDCFGGCTGMDRPDENPLRWLVNSHNVGWAWYP
jgi:hypothetical protein